MKRSKVFSCVVTNEDVLKSYGIGDYGFRTIQEHNQEQGK